MNETTEADEAVPPPLPQFYKRPQPLVPSRHATAGLKPRQDFAFAQETNAIALTLAEFASAARSYPIVFSMAVPIVPFAVVGLRDGENLFVDGQGKWREDAYVPAYVRRYPFIFSEVPNSRQLVLCVDEAAENFERESTQPFFRDGKPSAALQRVLGFGEAFQAQYEDTCRFGHWLDQHGMLEDKIARVQLDDSEPFTLRGFKLLNRQKLTALEDAQVIELHKKGWLPLLHFHLQSLDNLALLGRLMRSRKAVGQAQAAASG